MKKLYLISLLVLFVKIVLATTYYVGPSGNNSNDGLSPSTAFNTINYAIEQVVALGSPANDKVILLEGNWPAEVKVTAVTATENWASNLLIEAENPNVLFTVLINDCQHLTYRGFKTNGKLQISYRADYTVVEEVDGIGANYWSIEANEVTLRRCNVTDYFTATQDVLRIATRYNTGDHPTNILIEDCCFSGSYTPDGNHIDVFQITGGINVRFRRCNFTHAPTGLTMCTPAGSGIIDGLHFEECYFTDGSVYLGTADGLTCTNMTMKNCVVNCTMRYGPSQAPGTQDVFTNNVFLNWSYTCDAVPHVFENNILKSTTHVLPPSNIVDPDYVIEPLPCRTDEQVLVTGVDLIQSSLSLSANETSQLTYSVTPPNAWDKDVTWSSSNNAIVSIDANGLLTGVSGGTAIITVTTVDGGFTDECTVTSIDDNDAPSIPANLTGSTVTTGSVALSWDTSSDNIAVTDYNVYTNGANPVTVAGTNTTITGLTDNTTYSFSVSAVDAAGNESAQCTAINVTTVELAGVASNSSWQTFNEATQTEIFTATFDAIPDGTNIDALTGILDGTAASYGDLACIIRFNLNGQIDARNASLYESTNTINYVSGTLYHFRVEIDIQNHIYSVYVTPQGGSEQTVASNFAFRSEQASVSQLTGWSIYAASGSHAVDNMIFTGGSSSSVNVTGVTIYPTSLSLNEGQTSDLNETVTPADATDKSVVWTSSDEAIATVDEDGLVTALSEGSCTITVTTNDEGLTAHCDVTVIVPQNRTEIITASTSDTEVKSDGSLGWDGSDGVRVGGASSSYDACLVIPFQLPVLNADEAIVSANLNVYMLQIGNSPQGNVDLYGLPYRTSNGVLVSDYWQGENDPNATMIQDNFATLSTPIGNLLTDSNGDVNLVDYINAQYASGAQGGDYIFIRLSPDAVDVSSYYYWSFATANSDNVPVIDIEISVPVPVINTLPSINTVSDVTLLDNAGTQIINLSGINDGDDNSQTISVTASSSNTSVVNNVSVNYTSGNSTGTLVFDPVAAGIATITITVTDDGGTANGGVDTKVISFEVTVEASVINVDDVTVTPTSLILEEGETADLTETVSPVDATDKSVAWSSSNTEVATVDTNGFVTAVSAGNAIITVTTNDGGFTAACDVAVNAVVSNLALNKPITVSAYQDDEFGYKPGENFVDGDVSDDARWSASGFPQWAEIDLGDNYELSSINLYPYQDRAYQYIIEAKRENGSYTTIVDRSINTEGADVLTDAVSGIARYVKITVSGLSGNTSIWVSLSELEVYGSVPATIPVDGITVSSSSLELLAGETANLTEVVSPADATDKSVVWLTSNSAVATVDVNGFVTAIDEGSCTISVTTNDGGLTAHCDITVAVPQNRAETITASTSDTEVKSDGSLGWDGSDGVRVGGASSSYDACLVIPFQLPVLNADETIVSANLNVYMLQIGNSPQGNVDLYGLPYRTSGGVLVSDYWQGAYDPNATMIQDNFATLSTPIGNLLTDSNGDVNLVDYINAQYASGAQAGDYIFIRLSPDAVDISSYYYWSFATANSDNVPVLDIEIGTYFNKSQIIREVETSIAKKSAINVWPNPLCENSHLHIGLDGFAAYEELQLRIVNISGQTVYHDRNLIVDGKGLMNIVLPIGYAMEKGVYILFINNKAINQQKKIIIR